MARAEYIFETNSVNGGFLVDRRTDQIVGTTSRGVDRYFVNGETNQLTGRVKTSIPEILVINRFTAFFPSVLASLVAGAMAAQSGTTVTVTATAHGIVGSAAKDGYRFFYPGSASIAAGWYGGLVWVDVNTVRFTNPTSQTVGSESVNGGAAFTGTVQVCAVDILGGEIGTQGLVESLRQLSGDATATGKTMRLTLDNVVLASNTLTTNSNTVSTLAFANCGNLAKQRGFAQVEGQTSGIGYDGAIDTSVDKALAVTLQLAAAQAWIAVDYLDYRVTQRG